MNGPSRLFLLRALGVILLTGPPWPGVASPIATEHEVKAAFLYNFTKFIEWPGTRFSAPDSPIVIGLAGRDPFAGELTNLVNGRQVRGRALEVRVIKSGGECGAVHLLFVPDGQERLLAMKFTELEARAIVTVGESDTFRTLGGMVRFLVQADKVRFTIYRLPPASTGIRISPQLLKLATRDRF